MQQFRIFRALGLSFRVWFRNFAPITLLAAVLTAPAVLAVVAVDGSGMDRDAMLEAFVGRPMYLLELTAMLIAPLITYRVVQSMNGRTVSMRTSLRLGVRGIVPAWLVAIVTGMLLRIPFAGPLIFAAAVCIWFVATPAAVAEQLSAMAALTRSSQLTSGRRWGLLGLSLLVVVIAILLGAILILPQMEHATSPGEMVERVRWAALAELIALGALHVLFGIVQAVSYVLLREDKDGMSHEELAKIFD